MNYYCPSCKADLCPNGKASLSDDNALAICPECHEEFPVDEIPVTVPDVEPGEVHIAPHGYKTLGGAIRTTAACEKVEQARKHLANTAAALCNNIDMDLLLAAIKTSKHIDEDAVADYAEYIEALYSARDAEASAHNSFLSTLAGR